MQIFCCRRFFSLLVHVLEIGLVISLAFRWLEFFLSFRFHVSLFTAAGDVAASFSFLALLLLLLLTLGLVITRQPRALATALYTLVFILRFVVTPARLGN